MGNFQEAYLPKPLSLCSDPSVPAESVRATPNPHSPRPGGCGGAFHGLSSKATEYVPVGFKPEGLGSEV